MNRFVKAFRALMGWKLPIRARYTYTSKFNFDKIPKNKWVFVSLGVVIDEVGGYWIERADLFVPRKKQKTFLSIGNLGEITIFNRLLNTQEAKKLAGKKK